MTQPGRNEASRFVFLSLRFASLRLLAGQTSPSSAWRPRRFQTSEVVNDRLRRRGQKGASLTTSLVWKFRNQELDGEVCPATVQWPSGESSRGRAYKYEADQMESNFTSRNYYWLTYIPLSRRSPQGWPAEELSTLVEKVRANPLSTTEPWRIAAFKQAKKGDGVFVFKQGDDPRGIIGIGQIVGDPVATKAKGRTHEAPVRFHQLVDPARGEFLLPLERIQDLLPGNLVTARSSGQRVPAELADKLVNLLSRLKDADADRPEFDPASLGDERERAYRAICIRRGQPEFRSALMTAYGGRCAITGCQVDSVLEAAHISRYSGGASNHPSNGLLLRADVHTLFDCFLLSIDPTSRRVKLASSLAETEYAGFEGVQLRDTVAPALRPSSLSLQAHFNEFVHGQTAT